MNVLVCGRAGPGWRRPVAGAGATRCGPACARPRSHRAACVNVSACVVAATWPLTGIGAYQTKHVQRRRRGAASRDIRIQRERSGSGHRRRGGRDGGREGARVGLGTAAVLGARACLLLFFLLLLLLFLLTFLLFFFFLLRQLPTPTDHINCQHGEHEHLHAAPLTYAGGKGHARLQMALPQRHKRRRHWRCGGGLIGLLRVRHQQPGHGSGVAAGQLH
jgi:hypothetical protein